MLGFSPLKPRAHGPENVIIQYHPAAYPSVQNAVDVALGAGSAVALDLDATQTLDDESVRGLIKLLRRGREVGAQVALRTHSDEQRRRLAQTALDRLFPIYAEAA